MIRGFVLVFIAVHETWTLANEDKKRSVFLKFPSFDLRSLELTPYYFCPASTYLHTNSAYPTVHRCDHLECEANLLFGSLATKTATRKIPESSGAI